MTNLSSHSISDALSFEKTIETLQASPLVDGIAEFGSRATSHSDAASDYDLLILVKDIPTRVFQMVTTIDGRIADIVLVETETVDALLEKNEIPAPRSFEGLFVQKMKTARIVYDASGRLARVQAQVNSDAWQEKDNDKPSDSDLYGIWFWQSFGLLHLERMAQSQNPIHQTAVEMMLTAFLSGTWRSYFDVRGVTWQGEKAAVRYWAEHDAGYLELVNQCLARGERDIRLAAYRKLIECTIAPLGKLFTQGETAVILAASTEPLTDVPRTLAYWNSLFGN